MRDKDAREESKHNQFLPGTKNSWSENIVSLISAELTETSKSLQPPIRALIRLDRSSFSLDETDNFLSAVSCRECVGR